MHHTRSSNAAFWESEKYAYTAQTVNDPFIRGLFVTIVLKLGKHKIVLVLIKVTEACLSLREVFPEVCKTVDLLKSAKVNTYIVSSDIFFHARQPLSSSAII